MNSYQNVLHHFLTQWPAEKVAAMTLEQYVSTGNPNTFTQWVENRTIELGTISGPLGSRMFGIYKRKKSAPLDGYENDELFTWSKKYGNNRKIAFLEVRQHINNIINYALIGDFKKIDLIPISDIFKWKIAYLYSNERLIPIFKRELLRNIATHYGLIVNNKTTVSEIQKILIENKPIELSSHEFMHVLCQQFIPQKQNSEKSKNIKQSNNYKKSHATQQEKDTDDQERSSTSSYIAQQTHNKIQNKLRRILIEKHGENNVECEKNYVDLTLHQNDCITLYEVKSDAYAATCIRQALGQIIQYAHRLDQTKKVKLFVVGQYALKENEIPYLEYIKKNINLDFDYLNIGLDK